MTQEQIQEISEEELEESKEKILELKEDTNKNFIQIGEELFKVKKRLPHGKWIPWIEEQLNFDRRTATRFISVYKNPELLKSMWGHKRDAGVPFEEDEIPKEPKYQINLGEIYELGQHRLVCGDSLNEENIKTLLSGAITDALVTDPPYNVGYHYNSYKDDLTYEEYKKFCSKWFAIAKKYSKFQIITPGTVNLAMWAEIEHWKSVAPWIKKNANNNGEISFLRLWEPIIFYGKPPSRRNHDIFEHNIRGEKIEHACPKPVNLFMDLIKSFECETILDLFGGSGTSIIVCENLNKSCFMIEKDPFYCSVIIERWENLTGLKAIKI